MQGYVIMFDLDGTLVDSAPDICRALNRTIGPLGRRELSVEEVTSYLGRGAHLFVRKALEVTGDVPEDNEIIALANEFLNDYARNPVRNSTLYPKAHETLNHIRSRGAILALCTNKPGALVPPVLRHFKLDSYFQTVVCGDDVQHKKPHGDHIRDTIVRASGSELAPAIMIGDNVNDFAAANEAGVASISVTFGYAQCAPDSLDADALVDHLDELVPTIESLGARNRRRVGNEVERSNGD